MSRLDFEYCSCFKVDRKRSVLGLEQLPRMEDDEMLARFGRTKMNVAAFTFKPGFRVQLNSCCSLCEKSRAEQLLPAAPTDAVGVMQPHLLGPSTSLGLPAMPPLASVVKPQSMSSAASAAFRQQPPPMKVPSSSNYPMS